MNRRDFIRKLAIYGGTIGLLDKLINRSILLANPSSKGLDYHRIVLLGDPHLPVRYSRNPDLAKQERIIQAKKNVIKDINEWDDVHHITVLGDIVAQFGNEEEYDYAKQFFGQVNKEISFIVGNHDYTYEDYHSAEDKLIRANAYSQQSKLDYFKETFGLTELYYSKKIGRYNLIFLSPDCLESPHLTEISKKQLNWFREELAKNASAPTLVFFHAPLVGTLLSYNQNINTHNFIAQPKKDIEEIINKNQQIILWVSGHTHTTPKNPSYASNINVFGGRVTNIHNTDMDRERIWSNSLYLYPDKIIVKTFNHKEKIWEADLERTINV